MHVDAVPVLVTAASVEMYIITTGLTCLEQNGANIAKKSHVYIR